MTYLFRVMVCLLLFFTIRKAAAQANLVYYDANRFLITGHAFKDAALYQRLPLRFKKDMRPYLWELSQQSAGIGICFSTNSPVIAVRWKTLGDVHFPHVAESLVKGVDLYAKQNGRWYFAGLGKPSKQNHESVVVKGMDSTLKEFMLNLPMYESVDSVFIGVAPGSVISNPVEDVFKKVKPIVFYGTSIVQGASAMRPGMAYPSIISRSLQVEAINLGFSGNALLDTIIAQAISEIDASCYVIDCGPNVTPALAREGTIPFIKLLKEARPNVPVLLLENIVYPHARFEKAVQQKVDSTNQIFREVFARLQKEGMKNLYYLPADHLIGDDGEATVDGVHPTDLGFKRLADHIERKLKKILKLK
jgi:hypothetical protein